MIGHTTLGSLPILRNYRSMRAGSWDRSGGNRDWQVIEPGAMHTLLDTANPGCIKHIWLTVGNDDAFPRRCVIRMFWDDEPHPSVAVPIGDFFGIGHGVFKDFTSLPLQMSPQDGRGMNCWFPMPFSSARIEVLNECENPVNLYYNIDYEEYSEPHGQNVARFHAQWNREARTQGLAVPRLTPENYLEIWDSLPHTTDDGNYLILEAEGSGVYVGCNLNIDVFERQSNDWYGEGDEMIVIDGEPWPPRLHGTGTEDYFNTAFGPSTEFCAPYHGITLYSGDDDWPFKGKNSMYRFHIEDPIRFQRSIRVSIEHGHANKLSNDYSSTAYWYQLEPHKPFGPLPAVEERLPR